MRRFAAVLVAVLATGSPAVAQADADAVITLERTTCFGTCPAYRVQITSDGRVEYEGQQFVRVMGHVVTTVAPEAVAALVDAFEKAGYFALADSYRSIANPDGSYTSVSDLPTTTTSIRIGSRTKRVIDYVGAPAALGALERRIDAVAGTMRWISVTPDVVLQLTAAGWSTASEEGDHFLHDAVSRGDADTCEALLQAGADPNGGSLPPLFLARDPHVIALLVGWGADANHVNQSGETPLTWAALYGVAASVQALLQAGAHVNTRRRNDGKTALQLAIERAAQPQPQFPGLEIDAAEFNQIVALLRAAGAR